MIFLQQTILWGLPLLLLPLVIHLLNRLRFRSVGWGAMQFLLAATRQSTRHARIRQWLLLALRMAAVALLVLALSRPLAGGWLGGLLGGPPETVVLLVDRSASMGTVDAGEQRNRAARARDDLLEAARQTGASRLVVIDSVDLTPYDVSDGEALEALPLAAATDTGADVPAMIAAALTYLRNQATGPTEIWIASDLQRSSWRPEEGHWRELATELEALPQRIRLRLLAVGGAAAPNLSVRVEQAYTFERDGGRRLNLSIVLRGTPDGAGAVPVRLNLDGNETSLPVNMSAGELRLQHLVNLGDRTSGGWGVVTLPADSNNHDNQAWFVYGDAVPLAATVVAESPVARGYLKLAAGPLGVAGAPVTVVDPAKLAGLDLSKSALLLWQGPLPPASARETVLQFVREGGRFLAFPSDGQVGEALGGLEWGPVETAAVDQPYEVTSWYEADGPLARTLAGESLPIAELVVARRRAVLGAGQVLAADDAGVAWLRRVQEGRGRIYLCGTAPLPDWSNLAAGPVLVPMVQRLLIRGGERLAGTESGVVGREAAAESGDWLPLGGEGAGGPGESAGAYRHEGRLVSLNRPAAEDEPVTLAPGDAEQLFGGVPVQAFRRTGDTGGVLPSELWRWLVLAMLVALAGEALLVQPALGRSRGHEPRRATP